jgi:glycerol uptake facilitator-like aquaporin
MGRVFDAYSLREHLQDQAFNSKEGGDGSGVWLLWTFVKTQVLAVLLGEYFACLIFSAILTTVFALSTGVTGTYTFGVVAVALASAYAIDLVIGKFGHVSGAHVNPAVSLLLYCMHLLHFIWTGGLYLFLRDTILLFTFWFAQFAGWFSGVGIAWYMIGDSSATANLGLPALGAIDGETVGQFRGLFIEVFCVSVYLGVYAFGVVDRRLPERYAGRLMGITLAAITFLSINFTGANFNFLRWLCTYVITGNPTNDDWAIYIFAPLIAVPIVFVAVEIWRRLIEPTPEGKADTMADPQMPPKNKYHSKARIAACLRGAPSYTPRAIKEAADAKRRGMGLPMRSARQPVRRNASSW